MKQESREAIHARPAIAVVIGLSVAIATASTALAFEPKQYGRVEVDKAVAELPEQSDNVLEERRLVDNATTSIRVFRVYKPVPRHHHKFADTYLQILSGKAEISIDGGEPAVAGAGEMVFWLSGVDHEVPRILEGPLVFLAIDSPARRTGDVMFFQEPDPKSEPKKW